MAMRTFFGITNRPGYIEEQLRKKKEEQSRDAIRTQERPLGSDVNGPKQEKNARERAVREMLDIPSFADLLALERRDEEKRLHSQPMVQHSATHKTMTQSMHCVQSVSSTSDPLIERYRCQKLETYDVTRRLNVNPSGRNAAPHKKVETKSSSGTAAVELKMRSRGKGRMQFDSATDSDLSNVSDGFYSDEDQNEKEARERKLADREHRRINDGSSRGGLPVPSSSNAPKVNSTRKFRR